MPQSLCLIHTHSNFGNSRWLRQQIQIWQLQRKGDVSSKVGVPIKYDQGIVAFHIAPCDYIVNKSLPMISLVG